MDCENPPKEKKLRKQRVELWAPYHEFLVQWKPEDDDFVTFRAMAFIALVALMWASMLECLPDLNWWISPAHWGLGLSVTYFGFGFTLPLNMHLSSLTIRRHYLANMMGNITLAVNTASSCCFWLWVYHGSDQGITFVSASTYFVPLLFSWIDIFTFPRLIQFLDMYQPILVTSLYFVLNYAYCTNLDLEPRDNYLYFTANWKQDLKGTVLVSAFVIFASGVAHTMAWATNKLLEYFSKPPSDSNQMVTNTYCIDATIVYLDKGSKNSVTRSSV